MRANSQMWRWLSALAIIAVLPVGLAAGQDNGDDASTGCPVAAEVTYSVYSDYIFRGINRSEYFREGREKPNHQLTTSFGLDIGALVGEEPGTCGILTFDTFFEWYAAQKRLDPVRGGQNWQEVDYTIGWSYDVEPMMSTVALGYTFYSYPNAKVANTQEWWFSIEHNDAWAWRWLWPENEDGVLNPSFALYHDVARGAGSAVWAEFGLSHGFDVCPNVTVTPSWVLGIDHNYYSRHYFAGEPEKNTTRFANMLWGLDITYDMTELVRFPENWGSVALSGFLFFSDALGNAEDNGIIQDEFYGGMSIGWSFGG